MYKKIQHTYIYKQNTIQQNNKNNKTQQKYQKQRQNTQIYKKHNTKITQQ